MGQFMIKLDEIDWEILRMLRENSETPIKTMASRVKLHQNTLLQRIKRLKKDGVIIKYTAEVNYDLIGYDLIAIIMIKVRKGKAGDMEQLKNLFELNELESIYATTGVYDLITTCRVKNRDHLLSIIKTIGTNPIVIRTMSNLVLFPYKRPHEYNPFTEKKK